MLGCDRRIHRVDRPEDRAHGHDRGDHDGENPEDTARAAPDCWRRTPIRGDVHRQPRLSASRDRWPRRTRRDPRRKETDWNPSPRIAGMNCRSRPRSPTRTPSPRREAADDRPVRPRSGNFPDPGVGNRPAIRLPTTNLVLTSGRTRARDNPDVVTHPKAGSTYAAHHDVGERVVSPPSRERDHDVYLGARPGRGHRPRARCAARPSAMLDGSTVEPAGQLGVGAAPEDNHVLSRSRSG